MTRSESIADRSLTRWEQDAYLFKSESFAYNGQYASIMSDIINSYKYELS